MIIKILGIADLATALSILLLRFGILPTMAFALGIYLIIKGVVFIKSITSMLDIAAGIIILIAFYGHFNIATWIAAIWTIQKGVISLFS